MNHFNHWKMVWNIYTKIWEMSGIWFIFFKWSKSSIVPSYIYINIYILIVFLSGPSSRMMIILNTLRVGITWDNPSSQKSAEGFGLPLCSAEGCLISAVFQVDHLWNGSSRSAGIQTNCLYQEMDKWIKTTKQWSYGKTMDINGYQSLLPPWMVNHYKGRLGIEKSIFKRTPILF